MGCSSSKSLPPQPSVQTEEITVIVEKEVVNVDILSGNSLPNDATTTPDDTSITLSSPSVAIDCDIHVDIQESASNTNDNKNDEPLSKDTVECDGINLISNEPIQQLKKVDEIDKSLPLNLKLMSVSYHGNDITDAVSSFIKDESLMLIGGIKGKNVDEALLDSLVSEEDSLKPPLMKRKTSLPNVKIAYKYLSQPTRARIPFGETKRFEPIPGTKLSVISAFLGPKGYTSKIMALMDSSGALEVANFDQDRNPITVNYCIETASIELEVLDSEDIIIPKFSDFIKTFSLLSILSNAGKSQIEDEKPARLDSIKIDNDCAIVKSKQSIPGVMPPPKVNSGTKSAHNSSASSTTAQNTSAQNSKSTKPACTYTTNKDNSLLLPIISNSAVTLPVPPVTIKGYVNKQFFNKQQKSIFKNVYCVLEVKSGVSILSCYKSSSDFKSNKTISVDYLSNSDMKIEDGNIISISITKDDDEDEEDANSENFDDNSISNSSSNVSLASNRSKVYTIRMELVDVPSIPDYKQKWTEALTKHVGYSNRKRMTALPK